MHARETANRRRKSSQHKLQAIKVDTQQEKSGSTVVNPVDSEMLNDVCKMKEATEIVEVINNQQDPTSGTICKINSVFSMHSELDIKHEGPISQQDNVIVKTEHNLADYYVMQYGMSNNECKTEYTETSEIINSKQDFTSGTIYKIESEVSMDSEGDIKDDGPIIDPAISSYTPILQRSPTMIKTEHNSVNYYVMQSDMMQHALLIQNPPMMQQRYYLQNASPPNYILPH
ncbi:hypothetical protein KM043_008026 [Ampulex compressa]|nr:hypothetical protein KM043_008026 [Ampulex compressa]